jgi:hypothetical protein
MEINFPYTTLELSTKSAGDKIYIEINRQEIEYTIREKEIQAGSDHLILEIDGVFSGRIKLN